MPMNLTNIPSNEAIRDESVQLESLLWIMRDSRLGSWKGFHVLSPLRDNSYLTAHRST
jgi:hypothetical protein